VRLLLENTGDDLVMVGVSDARGRDVAVGTATEKATDTIRVIGSKGVHKIAIAKLGQDGEYRVVLEVASN
jgi:flavin-binding protein dodecin